MLITAARAPRQHRALADGLRGDRRAAAWPRRSRERASSTSTAFSALLERAHAAGRASRMSPTRSAPCCRSRRSIAPGARARHAGAARRRAGHRRTARSTCSALGCDFYAFSGHKVYGPTGIGVLYGREALLAAMPPWQGGGDMILTRQHRAQHLERAAVEVRGRHAQHLRRHRPGRGAAITSRRSGASAIAAHEQRCWPQATAAAARDPGPAAHRHRARARPAVVSFTLEGVHPHDIGTILDQRGRRRSAPAITARCRSWTCFGLAGHGARLLRLLQHRRPTSTRLVRGARARCARCSR